MYALEVKNLKKMFSSGRRTIKAVDNVSFSIKKGEIFGLLGVNGAGKSTTINILSGLTTPDSGKVTIFGKEFFTNQEEIKQQFNVATAYYGLSFQLTVIQNLRVFAGLYYVPNPEEKIKLLSEKFMITHLFNTKIYELSSGERSRTTLVKALLNDPQLLFLDECTVGLDPDMAEITRSYIQQYNKETGCTILFTSHYMQEVEQLCHRIAFMDSGKIINVGKAKELVKEMKWQTVRFHFSRNVQKAIEILEKERILYEVDKEGVITIKIKNKGEVLYPLFEKFISAKVVFDDVHLDKPTLEDYFIKQSRK